MLREFGVDPEKALRPFGVSLEAFTHPDNTIPFQSLCRIVDHCVALTGREDVGLLVGEQANASKLGLVGFLLQQADNVRSALGDLAHYLHYSDRGAIVRVSEADGLARLGYAIYEADAEGTAQIYDGAIAIARNILRDLCGPSWSPVEILLARRAPSVPARYERFFGAPVSFNADESAIIFPAHWLDTPIRNSDPELRRLLQEQIDAMEVEEDGDLSEQVRRIIRATLLTSGGSLGAASGLLNLAPRTLARRLKADGTSFKEISDEVHFSVARQYLANTSLSVTEVGLAMKYSESSAFTRAFRRWAGMSPSEWRAEHGPRGSSAPL